MANGIPTSSGIPLLDSLQRTPRLEPTSPFQAPRPSLPAVHLRDGSPAATGTPAFAQMRARANSGPNLQHPGVLPTAVPTMPVAPAPGVVDVPPEIDAEIASIVGRVMGAFTLEGDLVGGAEWRAGPAPELPKSLGIGLPSLAVGAGRPLAAGPDQGHRRNSMPMNHFAPPDSPATADDARATPPSRLAAVSENAFCPFGMQPPQTGSPLLPAASIPLGGLAAQPQAHPGFAPASSQCISLPSPFEQQQQQQHRMALGFAPPPPPPSLFLGAPGVHGSSVPFSVVPFQAPPLRTAVQPLTLPADPQAGYSMSYGPPFLTPDPWSPPKQTNGTAVQPQLHPLHMLARPTSTTQLHQQPQQQ
ncbi:hypothetical protein H4R19_006472 [Coemansia spiralis]|nr:hypothetical protein H4R19_006472 [Coemansia spiralis]